VELFENKGVAFSGRAKNGKRVRKNMKRHGIGCVEGQGEWRCFSQKSLSQFGVDAVCTGK
jgi:hypothetical protein